MSQKMHVTKDELLRILGFAERRKKQASPTYLSLLTIGFLLGILSLAVFYLLYAPELPLRILGFAERKKEGRPPRPTFL